MALCPPGGRASGCEIYRKLSITHGWTYHGKNNRRVYTQRKRDAKSVNHNNRAPVYENWCLECGLSVSRRAISKAYLTPCYIRLYIRVHTSAICSTDKTDSCAHTRNERVNNATIVAHTPRRARRWDKFRNGALRSIVPCINARHSGHVGFTASFNSRERERERLVPFR